MASSDNIFNVILIAIVAYIGYIFVKGSTPGITPGTTTVPSSATPQLIDPCAINPLQPNCIANWFWRIPPVEPSTAHPSQTPFVESTRHTSFNICPYNSNLLIGDRNCKPVEQGGIPLATLEPWNPAAQFYDFIGRP